MKKSIFVIAAGCLMFNSMFAFANGVPSPTSAPDILTGSKSSDDVRIFSEPDDSDSDTETEDFKIFSEPEDSNDNTETEAETINQDNSAANDSDENLGISDIMDNDNSMSIQINKEDVDLDIIMFYNGTINIASKHMDVICPDMMYEVYYNEMTGKVMFDISSIVYNRSDVPKELYGLEFVIYIDGEEYHVSADEYNFIDNYSVTPGVISPGGHSIIYNIESKEIEGLTVEKLQNSTTCDVVGIIHDADSSRKITPLKAVPVKLNNYGTNYSVTVEITNTTEETIDWIEAYAVWYDIEMDGSYGIASVDETPTMDLAPGESVEVEIPYGRKSYYKYFEPNLVEVLAYSESY